MKSIHRSRVLCEWDDYSLVTSRMQAALASQRGERVPLFLVLSEFGGSAIEQRVCSELWTEERRVAGRAELPQAAHLARLQLADLVLDTAPFGAHATASDALWAGVPIITCEEETFPSRVAGRLLHAIGLPQLVARDFDEYLDIAQRLATDADAYAALRAKLDANRLTTPLFDVATYTRVLELLFERMWLRRQNGEAPATLDGL